MNHALKSARGRGKPVSWERGSKLLALIMRRLEKVCATTDSACRNKTEA